MASVVFDHVVKRYGDQPVVRDLSLHVRDQELLVLVGPSGCGKSTALRMIAGLEDVTDGRLLIGDRVVNDVDPKHRDVAMVFQNYALYPHMTCYENMAFALRIRKVPKDEIRRRVQAAAASLEVEHLLDRKPKALSGGQRQRIAIGRAIVREPRVFLMDEPLSNLDAKLRVSMRAEIKRLHRRHAATMVYVTHDQIEAMTLGDRLAILHEGELMQCDTAHEIYTSPVNLFVATFIGSPRMNVLRGDMRSDGDASVVTGKAFRLVLPRRPGHRDGEVLVGVRPEHLGLAPPGLDGALHGTVQMVEPVGSDAHLYVDVGGAEVIARVPEERAGSVGPDVALTADPAKVHAFDARSEVRLA